MSDPVAPPPGAHGDDVAQLAGRLGVDVDDLLDLAVSVNPCAPDVAPLVASAAHTVRHYPDAGPARASLARALGIDPERIVLTNGGAEAIALVAAAHPKGWVDDPDFSLYARHLTSIEAGAPRWRSNPHNPTGRLAPRDERADVWDESFYALATGCWTRGDAGATVVASLTKLFACPGLRIGYVIAPDAAAATQLQASNVAGFDLPQNLIPSPSPSPLPVKAVSANPPAHPAPAPARPPRPPRARPCRASRSCAARWWKCSSPPASRRSRRTRASCSCATPPGCANTWHATRSSCATPRPSGCRAACGSRSPTIRDEIASQARWRHGRHRALR